MILENQKRQNASLQLHFISDPYIPFGVEFVPFGGKNTSLGNAFLFSQAGIRIFTAMEKQFSGFKLLKK